MYITHALCESWIQTSSSTLLLQEEGILFELEHPFSFYLYMKLNFHGVLIRILSKYQWTYPRNNGES